MRHFKVGFLFILIISITWSCDFFSSNNKIDISDVNYQLELNRFDSAFFGTDVPVADRFEDLNKNYPNFLKNTTLQFWEYQFQDVNQKRLYKEVENQLNFKQLRLNFESSLKHVYYFYPHLNKYKVYSYISNLDFYNPLLVVDSTSTIFLASDMFLGQNHPAYQGLDKYLAFYRQPNFIVSESIESITIPLAKRDVEDLTLVNEMIWWGKILYFKEQCLPDASLSNVLRYSDDGLAFCEANENEIWLYFVKNNLLFDSSEETKRRFIRLAPFSKFYTDLDNHSPGMIGKWIGYKIVNAYMENNPDVTIQELMANTNHQRIFTTSKYRP